MFADEIPFETPVNETNSLQRSFYTSFALQPPTSLTIQLKSHYTVTPRCFHSLYIIDPPLNQRSYDKHIYVYNI